MPKKSKRPLERRGHEIIFYEGDWDELTEILSARKVPPSVFLREFVSKVIRRAREGAQMAGKEVEVEL